MLDSRGKTRKRTRIKHRHAKNLILTLVLLLCLSVIYKFNFKTKSEIVETTSVSFKEYTEYEQKSDELKVAENELVEIAYDENGKKYFVFPDKIAGYHVSRYRALSTANGEKVDENDIKKSDNSNLNTNTNSKTSASDIEITNKIQNVNTNSSTSNNSNTSANYNSENKTNTSKNFSHLVKRGNHRDFYSEEKVESTTTDSDTSNNGASNTESDTESGSNSINNNSNPNQENNQNTSNTESNSNGNGNDAQNDDNEGKAGNSNSASQNNETTPAQNDKTKSDDDKSDSSSEKKDTTDVVDEDKEKGIIITGLDETIRENTYLPGEKYFISDGEILSFEVMYKTAVINDRKLYKRDITFDDEGTTIVATGYMPDGYDLSVIPEDKNKMTELKKDVVVEDDAIDLGETEVLAAYDISIVKYADASSDKDSSADTDADIKTKEKETKEKETEEKANEELREILDEYQPKDYNQTIELSIASQEELSGKLNSGTIIPVHVKKTTVEVTNDEGQTYETESYEFDQINISNQTNDTIEFYTDSFSPFMVLRLKAINANSIIIDDRTSDENYYQGLNYTDGLVGTNQNIYPDDKKVEVTINYYGFDSVNGPTKKVPMLDDNNQQMYDPNTGDPLYDDEPVSGYVSSADNERQNLITYKLVRYKNASNNISVELIDNPFMDRPIDKFNPYNPTCYGFDGWVSHDSVDHITIDNATKEQTLTRNVGSDTDVTINVYVKWSVANYIFWGSNGPNYVYQRDPITGEYVLDRWGDRILINNTGKDPTQPIPNRDNAINYLVSGSNYKNATGASDRELNVLVIMSGSFDVFTPTKAITITSLYDSNDYRNSSQLNVNASVILSADLQIDFLRIGGSRRYKQGFDYKGYYLEDGTGASNNENNNIYSYAYFLCGNMKNLRMGRGITIYGDTTDNNGSTTFTQIIGGYCPTSYTPTTNDLGTCNNYKLVVESGKYLSVVAGTAYIRRFRRYYNYQSYGFATNYTASVKTVLGDDIDRVSENNDGLNIFAGYASRTGAGTVYASSNSMLFDLSVKSGNIGIDLFNDDRNSTASDPDYPYSGIYVGGHYQADNDKGHRRIIVEGGRVSNIIGGLGINSGDKNTYKTYMYVKNGSIINIVGGAGRSTTYGDRMIQVTGGSIDYSVSGASNGFFSESNNPGDLSGKTMVYVGGTANIGTQNDSLYGVSAGSVLGAGNGNNIASIATTVGKAEQTHVIINDGATVNGSVYAGGNYGQVRPANYTDTADYTLTRQNMSQSISSDDEYVICSGATSGTYITNAGNNTRVSAETLSGTELTPNVGRWRFISVTGGYYVQSVVDDRYLNIVYVSGNESGLGYAYYEARVSDSPQVFTVQNNDNGIRLRARANNTNICISPTNYSSWYGNPRYYRVRNTDSNVFLLKEDKTYNTVNENLCNIIAKVDVLGGTIQGNTYGGSNNNNICGSTQINVDGGTINGTVYGGSNTTGTIKEQTIINVRGGTIGTGTTGDAIFAGGKGEDTLIAGKATLNITNTSNAITVNGNIYGGSEKGRVNGIALVNIDCTNDASKQVALTSKIFGGGKGTDSITAENGGNTSVIVNGLTNTSDVTVYGGANIKGCTYGNILVKIGENRTTYVKDVYAGGESSDVLSDTESVYVYAYDNATIRNVYGGGNNAGIEDTHANLPRAIYINGATITENVYGGSNNTGELIDSNVYMSNGATAVEVFGGGFGQNTTVNHTNVYIDDAAATNIYGGGNEGVVNGSTNVVVEDSTGITGVYAGGKGSTAIVTGTTYASIDNSTISGVVFGGGNAGNVNGSTTVEITNGSNIGQAFGGGSVAEVTGNTSISITESSATNVFGGGQGAQAIVGGSTTVVVDDTTVSDSIYGGGDNASVTLGTSITIRNGSSSNSVYGGGNRGAVGQNTNISITSSTVNSELFGGGNAGNVAGSATVVSSSSTIADLYGGGKSANIANTNVSVTNSSVINNAYGGGQGGGATVTQNAKIIVTGSTINNDIYGGGYAGKVLGSTVVGLTNAAVGENAYAAGNGETATVGLNSYIYAEGTTTIGKSIFGGGNAATTGDNSSSAWAIVDIAGATIGKNVYGGANSSVIKGHTIVNVGLEAINNFYANPKIKDKDNNNQDIEVTITNPNQKTSYTKGTISIAKTVFGGGEQMVEGKDEYDFNSISVEGVITINIDGTGYDTTTDINIGESVFGSGNASSANRNGDITITNYGTDSSIKRLTSIQRAGTVTINSSVISIYGVADSTNVFGNVDFSLNIIELLKLKDNSVLYLYNGANRLSNYESVYTDSDSATGESYNRVTVKNTVYDENDNPIYVIDGNRFCTPENNVIAYIGENNKYFSDSNLTTEITADTKETIDELITNAAKIVTDSVVRDTDNRIYIYNGKNLNISSKEGDDIYDNPGTVKGMTFFGEFKEDPNTNAIYTGIFDKNYTLGSNIQFSERDFSPSYVMGYHYDDPEHDILIDGFYTNYENVPPEYETYTDMEDDEQGYHSTMYCSVITPTPPNAKYYAWYAKPGEKVYRFDFKLTASKFSSFATVSKRIAFLDGVYPNAELTIQDIAVTTVNSFGLYDKNTIPNVASTDEEALTKFGLVMKTGDSGWKSNAETEFFYNPNTNEASFSGNDKFEFENSNTVPSMNFYLFNSHNITEDRALGEYSITMTMEYPIDALNKGRAIIIFGVGLETRNYADQKGYNAAITPSEQFDLFTSNPTNISNKSAFSTYFELAQEDFITTEFVPGIVAGDYYNSFHRVISTRDYVFPKGTTITMIDRSIAGNPKYYYYDVTQNDVNDGKTVFELSDFYLMGNKDAKYDETAGQAIYYDSNLDYEYESFIFNFNFESSEFQGLTPDDNIQAIVEQQPITFELRGDVLGSDRMLATILDTQAENVMKFGIYKTESKIEIEGSLNKRKIYLGNQMRLTATTEYDVSNLGATEIYDTRYFDKKLGIILTLYQKMDNGPDLLIKGADILGISFTLNGHNYYPRTDGTTRIKIADKVSNVNSAITVNTEGAALASGDYYFIIQSFGSADGIYFGTDVSAVSDHIEFEVVNDIFGLNVVVPDRQSIVEGDNGCILNEEGKISDDNDVNVSIGYQSGLANPFLGISLYRRKYDIVYGNEYEKVDIKDLFNESFEEVTISYSDESLNEYEYKAFDVDEIQDAVTNPMNPITLTQDFSYKEGPLRTGTYKLVYTLYDRYDTQIVVQDEEGINTYVDVQEYEKIGEDYAYIIIK